MLKGMVLIVCTAAICSTILMSTAELSNAIWSTCPSLEDPTEIATSLHQKRPV